MSYEAEKTYTGYKVALDEQTFELLIKLESKHCEEPEDSLHHKLKEIRGVQGVDYNGHFGAAIFFEIDVDHDTPSTLTSVNVRIASHITELQKLS